MNGNVIKFDWIGGGGQNNNLKQTESVPGGKIQ